MPPSSPTLYKLAADRKYDFIPRRVNSHPLDLQWSDRYGSTALHILCQARTCDKHLLQAVSSIVAVAPEQVGWPNAATWTPLHFAAEKRFETNEHWSTCLLLKLIRACPQAVSVQTHSGFKTKTPFGIACEADADLRVLTAMLRINPSLACEPFVQRQKYLDSYTMAETPLQILWKHQSLHTKDKMALLLQAAHTGTVPEETMGGGGGGHGGGHGHGPRAPHHCGRGTSSSSSSLSSPSSSPTPPPLPPPFYILHAACSVRCPREYFSQLLLEHADQISLPDHFGLYPLHYAVGHSPHGSGSSSHESSPVYTQFVIESLLKICPQAAQVTETTTNRLPLHMALETLQTWHKTGLYELVYCYPDALRRPDPMTGLVPFLASATAATKSRLHLSTTYELLLAAPEMIHPTPHRKNTTPRNPTVPCLSVTEGC